MTHLQIWLALIGMAGVTIVTRAFFLMAGERVSLPDRVQKALRYAPGAALAAIILPDLMTWQGHFSFGLDNFKLIAGVAAGVFYLVTRRMLGMIAVGMAVYTALRLFG